MKNFAKLAINYSLWFIIIFIIATGFRFLSLHVNWVANLPPKPESALTLLTAAADWALTLALFITILLALSYSARRNFNSLMSVAVIMGLSLFFCILISIFVKNRESIPPSQAALVQLGGDGLILSGSLNKNETAVILLEGNTNSMGPRVISEPEKPLIFQENSGANFYLPPVPFGDDTPWFLKSLSIDIRLNSEILHEKFSQGFFPFLIYAGALIYLLSSLGYIIKISVWPLVNLFLGLLIFRGILTFEVFINSPSVLEAIGLFLKNMIPVSFAIPLIFFILGSLMHLYSFLVFVIKRRAEDDYE